MGRIHTGKVVYRSVGGGRGGGGKHCFSLMVYIVHSNNARYSACLSFTIFFSFESFWYLRSLSKMTHPVQLPIQAKKQDKRVMRVKVGSNGEKKELDNIWKNGGGGGGGRQFRAGGHHKIGGRKPLLTTWEMTILGVVYRREGQTFCTLWNSYFKH